MVFELKDSEEVLLKKSANLFRGFEGVGGKIYVTNNRILFKPHTLNLQTNDLEIHLKDITFVVPRKTMGIISNGMLVTTQSGQQYKFVVNGREEIIEIINKTIETLLSTITKNKLEEPNSVNNDNTIDGDSFIDKLTKFHKLFIAQILTQEEFQMKKKELISDLDISKSSLSKEDFLISLINLKTNNILSQDDILSIKNILNNRG